MPASVLIVEDDPRIARLVRQNLEAAGLACRVAADGDAALAEFERDRPALLVLDLMIPGPDGHEVCRRIRRTSDVPILMLTARGDEAEKVLGFELGADDYLVKPVSTRELVARVRALLRRSGAAEKGEPIRRGGLLVDPARRVVERDGERCELTTLEFDLLHFLVLRPGRVFSRDDLLRYVWGEDRVVDNRTIDSLVSRLRRRIEPDPANPCYVQTVWGAGYRFAEAE